MFVCEKCGWLHTGRHCPRCGKAAGPDVSGEVTLSGYGGAGDSGSMEERESAARELLWDAMHSSSPDPDTCLGLAEDLRISAPEDYYANFADAVFSGGENMTARFLSQPRVKGAEMFAEPVLDYMCAHMSTELYPVVKRYLEKSDIAQPEKYEAVIDSYLSDYLKKEMDEAEEKKRKEDSDRLEAAARDTAEKIVKGLAERAVRDAAERAEAELKETLERRESEEAEKLETAAREAAEKIVKEVAEREIREINERKERESREAEERERKEKEERRKAEDERKRREQQEAADRAEKEKREAEALKRKREEESLLSADGYSKGFEFKFEKQDGGYILTWIGDCEDKDILIPPMYNGSSVTGIGDKAFVGCKDIKSVTVPSGVTYVGDEAFAGCTGLESVKFPDTLETIGDSAFKDCWSLKTLDMPKIITIGNSAFSGCRSMTGLVSSDESDSMKNDLIHIYGLFGPKFVMPSGVTSIGANAFDSVHRARVYIPLSLKYLGKNAFGVFTTFYYLGTVSQWNEITKDRYFVETVYFYSASRPRELGHFWHYDQNGKPTDW